MLAGRPREGPSANVVVLAPMLWELDGRGTQPAPALDHQVSQELARSRDRYLREMRLDRFQAITQGDLQFTGAVMPGEFDRPIGISWRGAHSPLQAEPAEVTFRPTTIRLTRATARTLAETSEGRFDVTFTDDAEFGGVYTLHLRIDALR